MCEWNTNKQVFVIRHPSMSKNDGWHAIMVDACIANVIQDLNNIGIITVGCCCGHHTDDPSILVDFESEEDLMENNIPYHDYENRLLEIDAIWIKAQILRI